MNVDDLVAERIAAARARIRAAKRRRDELSAARRRGLAARQAAKLRNLAAPPVGVANDDTVIVVTSEEFHASAAEALARLGLTYSELESQARAGNFSSAHAHSLWVSIGDTVDPNLLEGQ